jgi:SAM-dependent methyltransferase
MKPFTMEENRKFWDDFAKKTKDSPFGASGGRHLVEIENNFIFSQLKRKKYKTLLDVGCGNGQRTLLFSKYVSGSVLGIDYSNQMIREANVLLNKQKTSTKNRLSFQNKDIRDFSEKKKFDVIISCRCIINQSTLSHQIKLFESLHNRLNPKGSLIIAEISKEGMNRLNSLRSKFGLKPMTPRWHNFHLEERKIFPYLDKLFEIKEIKRAGTFYFLSRVIHPSVTFPKEPEQESKINEIALKSELLLQKEKNYEKNIFENYGAHLLIHFIKK